MTTAADLTPDEEIVLAVFRYFRRIRREQPTQLWLNEQFLSLNHKVDAAMTVNTEQLAAAITPLSDAVQGAITAITGIPQIVADAVKKALADAGADESGKQAIIDRATAEAVQDTKKLLDAVNANLAPAPAPEPLPAPTPDPVQDPAPVQDPVATDRSSTQGSPVA